MKVLIFIVYALIAGGIWYLITGLYKTDQEKNEKTGCIICIVIGIISALLTFFLP